MSRRLRGGFGAAAVVLVALLILLVIELANGKPAASASGPSTATAGTGPKATVRQAALAAAIAEAPVLFSYDYRTLDKNLASARALTTGAFTAQYDSVSVPAIKPLAAKYQVVVKAVVLSSGIADDSNLKQIKVLVFVKQTVTNTQLAAPRVDENRTLLTMTPAGKVWKVSAVAEL